MANLAGLPAGVITRARQILKELESQDPDRILTRHPAQAQDDQLSLTQLQGQQVTEALQALNVETLTPIEAMNELYRLKKMLDE